MGARDQRNLSGRDVPFFLLFWFIQHVYVDCSAFEELASMKAVITVHTRSLCFKKVEYKIN